MFSYANLRSATSKDGTWYWWETGGRYFWNSVNFAKNGSYQTCSPSGWFMAHEVSGESLRKARAGKGKGYHQWNQNKLAKKGKRPFSPQILSPET